MVDNITHTIERRTKIDTTYHSPMEKVSGEFGEMENIFNQKVI